MLMKLWVFFLICLLIPFIQTANAEENGATQKTDIVTYGVYGKNNIGLYKQYGKCFFAITGKNNLNQDASLAIWLPTNPNEIFIFPGTTQASYAISILNNYHNKLSISVSQESWLNIGNKSYKLTFAFMGSKNHPAYIFLTTSDLSEQLLSAKHFSTKLQHMEDVHVPINYNFDLDGFTKALATYKATCISP